ncbi:MAG TPA: hypothetical protein VF091_02690 [Gaiellaceae bacterium]
MAKTLPVPVGALRGLLKEIAVSARDAKPLVVGGARELAPMLRRELGHDAAPGGVRDSAEARGAAVYVHVMGGTDDAAELKRARRARVPIIAVADARVDAVPHVLATDVVRLPPGQGFPVDEIAAAIAHRLGEDGAPLAARVPVLRREVARELIGFFSRKNGLVGAAVFVPGVDLPILALNQLRLVLRLHQAYGLEVDPRERLPEIVATVGAGFGFRAVARELLDLVPFAGWAIKGGVAYAGTRALGEATLRRLEPGGHG